MKFLTSLFAAGSLLLTSDVLAQNCGVNVTPLIFGSVDAMSGVAVDSTGSVSIDCDSQITYQIRIDEGQNSQGGFTTRRMRNIDSATFMQYNLFLDSSRAMIWGDGTGGSQFATGMNPGVRKEIPVYGRISAGQNLSAGEYTDSVTVIIEW